MDISLLIAKANQSIEHQKKKIYCEELKRQKLVIECVIKMEQINSRVKISSKGN